jgi:predicted nucleotide-binding protein
MYEFPPPPPSGLQIGPSPRPPTSLLAALRNWLKRAETHAANPNVTRDALQTLTSMLRNQLAKVYGETGPHQTYFASLPEQMSRRELDALAATRVEQIKTLIAKLEQLAAPPGDRVFIGHGRSLQWRVLKDFIQDTLHLQWEEFNRESVAGHTTSERLDAMLSQAGFAFLVMTAEEERLDAKVHARDNVIHELGLFQGRLSRQRAIVLLEDGCATFSNIDGLTQIRFPKDDIAARFEEIRGVLAREGFIAR